MLLTLRGKSKVRQEGANLTATDPGLLWKQYMLLGEIEQAFKEMKRDLLIRPIHHQEDIKIEAHIFVAFSPITVNNSLPCFLSFVKDKSILEQDFSVPYRVISRQ